MTQHNTSVFKRIFFWLSTAGSKTLEQCPNWEQRKYVAFGATVLVPCLFAFIACAYAISTLTDNQWAIYGVATVWAFIIMTIDRALLASYRAFMSPLKKMGQFLLRFVVAALMGITIAHPLVLLLFKDTVTGVIEQARSAEIVEVKDRFKLERDAAQALIERQEDAVVFCPVTVDAAASKAYMNLLGPFVVNVRTMRGRQIVLTDQELPLRAELPLNLA